MHLAALAPVLAFLTPVFADLGKSVLYPEGLHDPLIKLDNLYVPAGSYVGVAVPQSCKNNGGPLGCNTNTIQAVAVTYNDCAQSWTVCRCDNANLDMNTILVRFGQVPVGLRSYVGTLLATYTANPNAYNAGGFIAINGDCDVSVFLHESSHSLDQGTSSSSAWNSAISSSSCVPDAYADVNAVEDFAQVNVLHVYQKLVGALDRSAACLQPQLDVLNNNARLTDDLTVQRCNPSVRPVNNGPVSAKFSSNSTRVQIVAPSPESTMDVVKAFTAKYGDSRNAPAASSVNRTLAEEAIKEGKPTMVYKEMAAPTAS